MSLREESKDACEELPSDDTRISRLQWHGKELSKFAAAIGRGEDPAEERALEKHESTFGELADRYLRDYAILHKKARSVADDKYYLNRCIPSGWQTRRLSDFEGSDIEQLHSRIGLNNGKYAANHALRLLRHMFNLARDWHMLASDNPAARIKLFKEQRRERYLKPEE